MMLISDMALRWDPVYKEHVIHYQNNRLDFINDAEQAWIKLTELGCPEDKLIEESTPLPTQRQTRPFQKVRYQQIDKDPNPASRSRRRRRKKKKRPREHYI